MYILLSIINKLQLHSLTSAQINALVSSPGFIIYNSEDDTVQIYQEDK